MFVEEAGGEHLYHYKWKSSAPDNIFTTFKIGKPFRAFLLHAGLGILRAVLMAFRLPFRIGQCMEMKGSS